MVVVARSSLVHKAVLPETKIAAILAAMVIVHYLSGRSFEGTKWLPVLIAKTKNFLFTIELVVLLFLDIFFWCSGKKNLYIRTFVSIADEQNSKTSKIKEINKETKNG